jgi:hypothetical protein
MVSVGGDPPYQMAMRRISTTAYNETHRYTLNGAGGSPSSSTVGAGVGGSTAAPSATATVTLSNTAASMGAGDTETTPAFLSLNYIIKY